MRVVGSHVEYRLGLNRARSHAVDVAADQQTAVGCQVVLLVYHQITTFVNLYPFNGARNYSRRARLAEVGNILG